MMGILDSYSKFISHHPWAAIGAILTVTLIMGYFSADFQSGTEEDSFTPDDEVSRANELVQERFGSQREQISVLMRSGSLLGSSSLLSQIELAERVSNSSVIMVMAPDADDPDSMVYPAEIVVRSLFYARAMEVAGSTTTGAPTCPDQEDLMASIIGMTYSLTFDRMRTVIRGGEIPLPGGCNVTLVFEPYSTEVLQTLEDVPLMNALPFLLERGWSIGEEPGSGLFIVSIADGLSPEEALEAEETLDAIAVEVQESHEGVSYITIGDELLNKRISEESGRSQGLLFTLALVMIVLVLVMVFRNVFDIVMTVLGLVIAVLWVFGIGGLLQFENNPSLTVVPVLVVGLGVDYGIHLTLRYREELAKGKDPRSATSSSGTSVGFALFLATLTTLVGFLSNLSAGSPGIRIFGVLNAVGVGSAFIVMMTLPPAARVIRDRWREKKGKVLIGPKRTGTVWGWAKERAVSLGLSPKESTPSQGIRPLDHLFSFGTYLTRFPAPVLGLVVVISVLGAVGGMSLEPTFDFRDFLPEGLEISDAAESVISDFSFSSEEAFVVAEGDVASPAVFIATLEVGNAAMTSISDPGSGEIGSPARIALDMSDPGHQTYDPDVNRIWHSNMDRDMDGAIDEGITKENVKEVYDAIYAADPEMASRVLSRDDDGNFDALLIRIPVNSMGGERAGPIRDDVRSVARPLEDLEGSELDRVTSTGGPIVQQGVLDSISSSQIESVAIVFIISTIILTVVFVITRKSIMLGAITMLPLVFVISWTLGSMYLLRIPLNVVTVTISAVAVGLGIDYSVHVSQRFMEDLERIGDGICAMSMTLSHTGTALIGSALTTVIGFAILSLSIIPPLAQFGQVTALSVTFALVSSVLVLPTLLILWLRGNHWYRRRFKGETIPQMEKECREPMKEKNGGH